MNPLRHLEFAVALDRHRSFARAAQAMHVTQPSFSRAIAALEARVGARLFDRGNHGVQPTPEGEVLLARARRLLADYAGIGDALDDQRALRSGRVTVGAGPYALEISVAEAAARLSQRHPQLQIELIEGDWRRFAPMLRAGEIELAVFDKTVASTDRGFTVEAMPAHPGSFFARAGHPLAGRRRLRLAELLVYPFVGTRGPVRPLAEVAGHTPNMLIDAVNGDIAPIVSTTSIAAAREIVRRTDGVGLATRVQLQDDLQRGRLAVLDVDWPGVSTAYGIVSLRERTLSPAAQAFAEMVREVEAERAAVPASS